MPARPAAWVLLGPTGAGKSPLGAAWEAAAPGRHHFDFGAHLRAVDAGRLQPPGLGDAGRAVVAGVLRRGALLTDDDWFVAAALLDDFLARRGVGPADRLLLNGLPRHTGQARRLDAHVAVDGLVVLEASPATVRARIARDPAGDRRRRRDDDPAAVARRLATWREKTRPLVRWYGERGVPALAVRVDPRATGEELLDRLRRAADRARRAGGGDRMAIRGHDHSYVETSDYPAARRFWEALGFTVDSEWGGEGHRACRLAAGDTFVVLAEHAPGAAPQGPTVHFRMDDPAAVARALDASDAVEVVTPLEPTHWNTRWIRVRDPDGHVWVLEAPAADA